MCEIDYRERFEELMNARINRPRNLEDVIIHREGKRCSIIEYNRRFYLFNETVGAFNPCFTLGEIEDEFNRVENNEG